MKKIIALSFCIILCGCSQLLVEEENDKKLELANPASTFCVEKGGELEIRNEENGQVGYCHISDGTVIEEWAYFREQNTPEALQPEIPEGCETWFDGCNNCLVGEGGMLACTRMFCAPDIIKEPTCIKFKEVVAEENIFCGGIAGISCENDMECKLDGEYPDAGGICVLPDISKKIYKDGLTSLEKPRICTMDYTPVCGVDGKTYGNKCGAGDIEIAHEGECE